MDRSLLIQTGRLEIIEGCFNEDSWFVFALRKASQNTDTWSNLASIISVIRAYFSDSKHLEEEIVFPIVWHEIR